MNNLIRLAQQPDQISRVRLGGLDVECSERNFRRTDGVHVSLMGRPGVYQSVRHGNHRSKLSVMCGRYTSAVAFETIT